MATKHAGCPGRPVSRPGTGRTGRSWRAGFTILELLVVMALVVITLAITQQTYGLYQERTATRRAAKLFGLDLSLARSAAVQGRMNVVIRFDEAAREYEVISNRRIMRRDFGDDSDVPLESIDLELPGDSVVFDARGVADLSGIAGSLGRATFEVGGSSYAVSFNALGASKVGEP
ncbi:MAG: prepilin-type N-terminal cleavage/methylation domain-containing protein [Gemmatimonadetes bacterium]|nr:prepilin-type N-terminal cleavage/methylation domain-containing protein [Gemmatimonadota bacterium]NIR78516.1 prepilin-type N-terminal cleavage/methylation domain-containing protein [Gemmatimonadota bacterium]NIT87132.1 prepilin-type N-terminal cleavage/methylation domain-containing protein [Gemmatimonadota bacterium]NIU30969.1 prepilin-type N-terminal cleavage/methylation domain-containing protein [Gemmatimonadota bacterium]NIU35730.1 prepilin-type N-terminal cleavage/methylation domain-con